MIRKAEADIRMLRFAEHLLASAVGTASSRLVMALAARAPFQESARRHEAARRCLGRHPIQP